MRVAYIDFGRISEILPAEFISIEQAAQFYPVDYIEKCQMVSDTVQAGMYFIDGEWQFSPVKIADKPATVEKLEAENKLLKAQLQAQSDRSDFIEDCIAEMATQVYGGV